MSTLTNAGLWAAAIGTGVMAGVYFAFSTFVMKALASMPRATAIAAMQSINEVIVSSPFLPLFFLTSVLSLGLAGLSLAQWSEAGGWAMLSGGLVYFVGMFLCTVAFNVPLNNALAAVEPTSEAAATVWSGYLSHWTWFNHLRTLASSAACGLFILAIVSRAAAFKN